MTNTSADSPASPNKPRSAIVRYGLAMFAVAFVACLRLLLDPYLGNRLIIPMFLLAAAWTFTVAGVRPAILSLVVGYAVADRLFFARHGDSILHPDATNAVALLTYLVLGLAMTWLGYSLNLEKARAEENAALASDRGEYYRTTLASIGDGVITTDGRARVKSLNRVAERLCGWTEAEAVGRALSEVFHIVNEQTGDSAEDPVAKVIRTGITVGLANHTVLVARDGNRHPIRDSAAPIRDAAGTTTGVVLVFRDATEERRAEIESETLSAIVRSSDDAIIAKDLDGMIRSWNPSAERLFGYSQDEAIGRHISLIVPPELREQLDLIMTRLRRGERVDHVETVRMRKDGSCVHVSLAISPIIDSEGQIQGFSKISRDITPRIEAEQARRESETRFRTMADSAPVMIWMSDTTKLCNWFNTTWLEFTGRSMEEDLGNGWAECVHDDDRESCVTTYTDAFDRRQKLTMEYRLRRHDGMYRWVVDTGVPMYAPTGEFTGYIGTCIDVTEQKSAADVLRSNEERLRLALTAGSVGVWDWEIPEDRVTWSDRIYDIHGVEPEGFDGRVDDFKRLIHPDDSARVEDALRRALEHREPYDVEFRIVRPSGELRWLSTRGHVFFDDQGQPRRMLGATIDTTDRKRAEETLRFFADTSDAFSALVDYGSTLQRVARQAVPFFCDFCVVYLLSESGQIERVAAAHFDSSKERLLDEIHARYPLNWSSRSPIVRSLKDRSPQLVEEIPEGGLERATRDDTHLELLRRLAPRSYISIPLVVRDEVLGCLVCGTSDSGRRYGSNDLRVAQDLARRAATAIDNARLYQEVKESTRHKDDFIAMLAHELRNPLAAIQYANQLAIMPGASATHETADIIARQVKTLVHLIDDLLDVSRINRNKIQLKKERVDGGLIARRAVSTVRSSIEERSHRLIADVEENILPLLADPTRLEQILVNLLSNAAKYTPKEGTIHIRAKRENGEAVFRVRDSGIGIDKPMLRRVFDLFMQADASLDRSYGGLGIGLTIVQKLVDLHGGTVSAASEGLGMGSEFVVRLPLAEGLIERQPAQNATPETRRLRILAVDDNADMVRSLGLLLSAAGHEVRLASDGQSALSAAEVHRPEVFLLDIGLPGMSGYELASELRRRRFPNGLFIAISGYGQPEDRERSKHAGFDFHLVKPVNHQDLLELLAKAPHVL